MRLKILGRVGKPIFFKKKILGKILVHAFWKELFFPENLKKILGFTCKFI